jgi:hypothetical protein
MQMPKKHGSRNYSVREQLRLVMEVARALPVEPEEWEAVAVAYNSQESPSTSVRSSASLKRKFSSLCRSAELTDELKWTELQKLTREVKCRINERVYRRRPHGKRLVEASAHAATEASAAVGVVDRPERPLGGSCSARLLAKDVDAGNTGVGSARSANSVSEQAQPSVDCEGKEQYVPGCRCERGFRMIVQQLDQLQKTVVQELHGILQQVDIEQRQREVKLGHKCGSSLTETALRVCLTTARIVDRDV